MSDYTIAGYPAPRGRSLEEMLAGPEGRRIGNKLVGVSNMGGRNILTVPLTKASLAKAILLGLGGAYAYSKIKSHEGDNK